VVGSCPARVGRLTESVAGLGAHPWSPSARRCSARLPPNPRSASRVAPLFRPYSAAACRFPSLAATAAVPVGQATMVYEPHPTSSQESSVHCKSSGAGIRWRSGRQVPEGRLPATLSSVLMPSSVHLANTAGAVVATVCARYALNGCVNQVHSNKVWPLWISGQYEGELSDQYGSDKGSAGANERPLEYKATEAGRSQSDCTKCGTFHPR